MLGKALRTALVRSVVLGCLGRLAAGFLFVSAAETLANATICRFRGCVSVSTIARRRKSTSCSDGGRPHPSGCTLFFPFRGPKIGAHPTYLSVRENTPMLITALTFLAKISLVTALPIAIIVVWKKRTNAHWITLLFCVIAFAVNFLAQSLLSETIFDLVYHDALDPILVFIAYHSNATIFFPWVLDAFIFGLIREGGRWLILRFSTAKVRLWQDGILFGIAYSYLALLFRLEQHFGNISPSHWNQIKNSIVEIVNWLNWTYHPFAVWYFPVLWIITLLFFNVVTSVLVLASVQQRKIRYLLIAIAVYIIYINAPPAMSDSFSHLNLDWFGPETRFEVIKELTRFLVPLPFFWLVLRLRKTMPTVNTQLS